MKLFRRKKRKDAPEENPEPLAETVAVKKPVKTKKKKEPAAEAEGKSSSSVAKKKSEPAKTVAAPEMVKEKESVIKKLKKKVKTAVRARKVRKARTAKKAEEAVKEEKAEKTEEKNVGKKPVRKPKEKKVEPTPVVSQPVPAAAPQNAPKQKVKKAEKQPAPQPQSQAEPKAQGQKKAEPKAPKQQPAKKQGEKQKKQQAAPPAAPAAPPPPPEKKVKKQIVLNCEELENRSALLCDGRLEEYELERPANEIFAGSIYLGRITRLEPSLEAAFVDIGAEKNAFLHYRDMLPATYDILEDVRKAENDEPEEAAKDKTGKLLSKFAGKIRSLIGKADKGRRLKEIEEKLHNGKIKVEDIPKVFPCGSELLVQVTKGPIGTKGARLTTNITIPGRYLVLLPYSKHIGLSSKIEDNKERSRLRRILTDLDIPDNMGMICRTVGEGKKDVFFQRDLDMLLEVWHNVEMALIQPKAPALVYAEPTMLERTVRDLLTDDIDEIVVDDPVRYSEMKANVEKFVGDDFQTKLVLYNRPEPVFDHYKITKQVAEIFNRIVNLPSGGYLCIDETEALIAIDINSGKSKSGKEAPEMILATNLEAAEEIARQMRLRNIGGQVVIDFIDMSHQRDRDTVFRAMERHLRNDKARTKVLPISRFGLMELTRQREHESVKDTVYDLCPYCNGSGHVKSAISMSVEIQRSLKEILKRKRRNKDFAVRVIMHPSIMARLKNNDADLLRELQNVYGKDLQFRADPTVHIEDFKLVDPETGLPVE